MNVCGIVCEYNPFHNGHRYHIEKAREITNCDVLVCVMSGNFVQRGEMAIADKWTRAETAIQNGCDLVVELPYPFVVQRGDIFAHGALTVLKEANINQLVFGSECNNIAQLTKIARQDLNFRPHLQHGNSSAKALEKTLNHSLASNDLLGVFYIKEVLDTTIQPYCIQRTNTYHDQSLHKNISSATAIRQALKDGLDVTHTTCMHSKDFTGYDWNAYYPYLQTLLTTTSKEQLASIFLMDEGIESLLKKQAMQQYDYDSFLQACVSKRYTKSSIQRTLTHLLTQTTKKEINALSQPTYLRILAYNTIGQSYLRILQDEEKLIASTFSKIPKAYREITYRSTCAYAHAFPLQQRISILKREVLPAKVIR